jgi:hypothetical protein
MCIVKINDKGLNAIVLHCFATLGFQAISKVMPPIFRHQAVDVCLNFDVLTDLFAIDYIAYRFNARLARPRCSNSSDQ